MTLNDSAIARRSIVGLTACLLLLPVQGSSQASIDLASVTSVLEREIKRTMVEAGIPSLSIALVSGEDVIWSAGFGDANLWSRTPATANTVYSVASTFKTVVATAILQLVEEGHIDLDDPVRNYLGELSIRKERGRDPITFRHLLTHTSGLPTVFSPIPAWGDSVPPPMRSYLKEKLEVVGPPLQRVRYSNMGYTLLAHLVEEITETSFQDYVRAQIFLPLGMSSIDFYPTPAMEERMAVPYLRDHDSGSLVPTGQVRFAEWPAANVWGTVEDQARWLAANLNGGSYQGRRILSKTTLELAHTRQYEDLPVSMSGGWGGNGGGGTGYGLGWWTTTRDGDRYIGHAGSVQGYTAFLHGNVDREIGVAILSNAHRAHNPLVRLAILATDLMIEHGP